MKHRVRLTSLARHALFSLTALCVIDGHLFLGQSVAWLAMLGQRAPEIGLQEAVADTFTGGSPCEICLAIQEEREDRREEAPVPESRTELKYAPVVAPSITRIPAAPDTAGVGAGERLTFPRSRIDEIPTPPPQLG